MNILLYGIQGSGKSTQGKLLSQRLHLPYLSMGHIFRELSRQQTREGRYIKETLASGVLVPDDIAHKLIHDYLKRTEYKDGWILDGFPRTLVQVKKFEMKVDVVFYITVNDKEALWRLSFRTDPTGNVREDETLKGIRQRIHLFHKMTEPVLEHYRKQNLLVEVNGERKVEEISDDMMSKIRWYQSASSTGNHKNGK